MSGREREEGEKKKIDVCFGEDEPEKEKEGEREDETDKKKFKFFMPQFSHMCSTLVRKILSVKSVHRCSIPLKINMDFENRKTEHEKARRDGQWSRESLSQQGQ
jgi:hypothetical protein